MGTYAESLLELKRGFIILGLTGYTGAGCSNSAAILKGKIPSMPPLDSIPTENIDTYNRLKIVTKDIPWNFTLIDVGDLIFLAAAYEAHKRKITDGVLGEIKEITRDRSEIIKYASKIFSKKKINWGTKKNAKEIIEIYEYINRGKKRNEWMIKYKYKEKFHKLIESLQNYGDDLRKYGKVSPRKKIVTPDNIFVLPEAIRRVIKAYQYETDKRHFIIDAFRNPYEVEFFKRRYNEFYLIYIYRNEKDRKLTLLKRLNEDHYNTLYGRERGKKTKTKDNKNISEWITSQNIDECAQRADCHIYNIDDEKSYYQIKYYLLRLMSLIIKPGCVPPTFDEKQMQLAMSARQYSGCLSRKVGAAVVTKQGHVLGIGWNDPPQGQVPCLLRTKSDLIDTKDNRIFSKFEISEEFRKHIDLDKSNNPFCFREEYQSFKDNIDKYKEYTRAIHAEERAFFYASSSFGDKINSAYLYVTDTPCNLCSKKAYHLGIKKIIYIDEYSGDSIKQTLLTGEKPISVMHFTGICGAAYFKLYCSFMPEKDFIKIS